MTSITDRFNCPISQEPLSDPVIDPCGHTFSRASIERWLDSNPSCPFSREPMTRRDLIPNLVVRDALEIFAQGNLPSLAGRVEDLRSNDQEVVVVREALESLRQQREGELAVVGQAIHELVQQRDYALMGWQASETARAAERANRQAHPSAAGAPQQEYSCYGGLC